jgi:DNA polymerase-3 subunit gamma/tau
MSYTALYRKWRPATFAGVVGQDHIVKTLINQIKADRIAHAYLFCGTRGTGKTSTAKIFAKAVNCEHPVEGSPCESCMVCKNITNNQSMNIIEIDAASNNGVDNIREIREEVKYPPTEGNYKVYIIDEVHMLSIGAFNALLKTLEEPPKHAIFILATTEPHKIPITILSRCQRYDFKRITSQIIGDTLAYYLENEGISCSPKGIKYIAKMADGSMRDALSILDQCIAFYLGEEITLEKVLNVLGAVDHTVFITMVEAIHVKDVKKCLDVIEDISIAGRDLSQFIADIINHLRNIVVIKSVNEAQDILDMSQENVEAIKAQSAELNEQEVIYYINIFSELEAKIKYITMKRVMIEVELIKLCQPSSDTSYEGIFERIRVIEDKIENGITLNAPVAEAPKAEAVPAVEIKKKINIEAIPEDIQVAIGRFQAVIDRFSGMEKAVLKKVTPTSLEDDILYIVCENKVQKDRLLLKENYSNINNILAEIHEKQFKLSIVTEKEFDLLAHNEKDISTGTKEAKNLFKEIKSKINFDVQQI